MILALSRKIVAGQSSKRSLDYFVQSRPLQLQRRGVVGVDEIYIERTLGQLVVYQRSHIVRDISGQPTYAG